MNSMPQVPVCAISLSPSAEVLVRRVLEAALQFVAAASAGAWNRDSNSLEGTNRYSFGLNLEIGTKVPPIMVRNWDCCACLIAAECALTRFVMNHYSCPELYNCPRVKMTPLIRVLLRCSAAEAMESICATCEQERCQGELDNNYVSPSGQSVKVVVGDDAEQMVGASAGSS